MHGGQSVSDAPTNAIASLALLAIKFLTIPTGSASLMARSVFTSDIFSSASVSICALILSRNKRANLLDEAYCCSLKSEIQPFSISLLARRHLLPVILGHISMKSDKPIFHIFSF